MIDDVVTAIIRQAALLTKPQQDEVSTRLAEVIATLVTSTGTEIDDELARSIVIPLVARVSTKLEALV